MRMTFTLPRPVNKGYALIMVMIFLAAALLVLGSVMLWTESNQKEVKRSNVYFTSQYAANAAVEQVIANMNRDYLHQSLNSASSYETNIPSINGWPIQYTFSSSAGANTTYVNIGTTSTNLQPLGSQWSGLSGYPTIVTVSSTATPQNQLYTVSSTVTATNVYADIPLFQFAVFYNMNLEIDPGSSMGIAGPVFCNTNIWAASGGGSSSSLALVFSNSVTAAGTIYTNYSSPGDPFMTGKTSTAYPIFNSTTATNHAQLNLPIGTNNNPASVEAVLQFPPSTYALGSSAAYTTNGQIYFANDADLIITNTGGSGWTNISVFWQDGLQSPTISAVPYDYYVVSNKSSHGLSYPSTTNGLSSTTYATLYSGYSFVTNSTFTDYRENSKTVDAIVLNVTNLILWATNTEVNGGSAITQHLVSDSGKGIDGIYIYNSVSMSSSILPGVRINNGAQLPPYGLAVASPDPLYVQGNYNTQTNNLNSDAGLNSTAYTHPAALYGDALTILSASWNDKTESSTESSRIPVATTVNAATLEGIVPSLGSNYSGGVENFLRLLEAWSSSIPLTYNGSIVVMFPSQYATNIWNGNVYGVPKRQWAFDLNFAHQGGLPAMTPRVKGIIRQGWVP